MKSMVPKNLIKSLLVAILFLAGTVMLPIRTAAGESGLEFGFQHRARFVDFDDITDYSDANNDLNRFFRFRSRLWSRLIRDDLELKLTLANEFRHYLDPERDQSYDEIFVDECYLKLPSIAGSGWSIAAGRQNLIRGDGFLLFDGSPLDGSRSIYFNSLIISHDFDSTRIELLGITNPAKDQYLPRIGDKEKPLIEHDEAAVGVFLTHKTGSDAVWEAVWLYKQENGIYSSSEPGYKPDRTMHVAGGRGVLPIGPADTLTCEFGGEFGETDPDRSITAWAGNISWKHRFAASMEPNFRVYAAVFSGDDPDTAKDEGWTPPFSRWPQWSELYIYSLARERGVAWWTNLWFTGAEIVVTPAAPVNIRLSYYRMMAIQEPVQGSSLFGSGRVRGDMLQCRLDYKLPYGLTGHALYEFHNPGDFYAGDDAGHFLRFELTWQFTHRMPL